MQEMWETWVQSLGQEDLLEEEMATQSGISAWKTPWTEEPGGPTSTGSQIVGHDWETKHACIACTHTSNTQNQPWIVMKFPVLASFFLLSPKVLHSDMREDNIYYSWIFLTKLYKSNKWERQWLVPITWRQKCWMIKSYETRITDTKVNKKAIVRLQIKQPHYVWIKSNVA